MVSLLAQQIPVPPPICKRTDAAIVRPFIALFVHAALISTGTTTLPRSLGLAQQLIDTRKQVMCLIETK